MRPSVQRVCVGVVLAWTLVSAAVACRAAVEREAAARGADRVSALEAEFSTLVRQAPSSGTIGYLSHYEDADSVEHTLEYYVAQYAFAPRLLQRRTDLEFLVVARDAVRPAGDERLADFVPVASSREGYRLYRKRGR